MLRITQLKLPVSHSTTDLEQAITNLLNNKSFITYKIRKRSIDARKKEQLLYSYTIDVSIEQEDVFLKKNRKSSITKVTDTPYHFPIRSVCNKNILSPIIVGAGPAGLFCAYQLAKCGLKPLIIERGETIEQRSHSVDTFWKTGQLNPESNVQFGEGGAGTFSDGKLNTMIKDKTGRIRHVIDVFLSFGAPEEIGFVNKPHIGTDTLKQVITNMRNEIIHLGGTFLFQTKLVGIHTKEQHLTAIDVETKQGLETLPCEHLILAIGHSARDTIANLYEQGLHMQQKPFAMGVRIEHPASMIQESQYGTGKEAFLLPTADYKVTHQAANGRNVFSFCMCPGGYVVNASSEENRLCTNGMSYQARDGVNSNSAIIVNVTPEDFPSLHPLAGMELQRRYEHLAYQCGAGSIPVQLFRDFCENRLSQGFGDIQPNCKGACHFGNLNDCLPDYIISAIIDGVQSFDEKIKGFARDDALLSGIEARTSSPVRIERNDRFQSNIPGIYPCGEGAGYAGGIVSAAVDGIRVAEAIAAIYNIEE